MIGAGSPKAASAVITWGVGLAAILLGASLLWGLRTLIVPAVVGGLLAYICRPLVAGLERRWIPRSLAAGLLLVTFASVALIALNSLRSAMPTEIEALELRVRALHTLTQTYQRLMGLDGSWTRGNRLYWVAQREFDPLLDRVSEVLALTPEERAQLVASRSKLVDDESANARTLAVRARRTAPAEPLPKTSGESPSSRAPAPVPPSNPPALGDVLATWVIAPLIFLFLLWDTGDIKRGLVSAAPNRLFEPTLAVLADLDDALGDYVRGIFLECCALGLTVIVLLAIVGVPVRWAIAIGIFTGASNVVPYMGFAAALLSGLAYALVAEDVHPLVPFVTSETFAVWVIVAVAFAELLKNVVYEPILLGGSTKLHPLVVVIGVIGGATLFGPAGMFLAIPTITVVKVLVASGARNLKAYGLV
jgi:predicted PurR-regulated permease PerM